MFDVVERYDFLDVCVCKEIIVVFFFGLKNRVKLFVFLFVKLL